MEWTEDGLRYRARNEGGIWTIVVDGVGPCVAFPARDGDEDCDELRERLVRFVKGAPTPVLRV